LSGLSLVESRAIMSGMGTTIYLRTNSSMVISCAVSVIHARGILDLVILANERHWHDSFEITSRMCSSCSGGAVSFMRRAPVNRPHIRLTNGFVVGTDTIWPRWWTQSLDVKLELVPRFMFWYFIPLSRDTGYETIAQASVIRYHPPPSGA